MERRICENEETGEMDLVEDYIGDVKLEEVKDQKYLGYVISGEGKNMADIIAMEKKSYWFIRSIINWRLFYFESAIILTLKRGRGAHCAPPSTFMLFVTKIANRTDSNSNCKFINIRCGRFDTIFRAI